jgi:rhamnulokinase
MRSEEYRCIAVDMGAGSIRVMLGTIGRHTLSYREVHRVPNRIVTGKGHDCWDMDHLLQGIREGIRMAAGSAGPVNSIGVDSWGVDYVVLDREGLVQGPVVAYRDKRTEGMEEVWTSMMPREETFRRTGINFYVFNTLFQILAQQREDKIHSGSRILFIPSYVNFLLSGVAVNELTISSTSQMLEVGGRQWDREILTGLGLDYKVLGAVADPGTCLGEVAWEVPGGRRPVNVAVCGHDTASVVAALPVEDPGFAYISAGTWCIVGIESEEPLLSREALDLGFTNERGFGNTYRILKNLTGLWLIQGLRDTLPGNPGYEELERLTQLAGKGEQVIDPDNPAFYHPENMKDAIRTSLMDTGQSVPPDMGGYLRCAYNSICFSIRYHLDRLEALSGREITILHMVGGGSQSDFLNQRVADICRRKLISGPVEGTTLGNMLVQGIAMDRIDGLEEGRRLVRNSFPGNVFLPSGKTEHLQLLYKRYLQFKV